MIALLAVTAAVKLYTAKFSPQARWQEQYDLGEQYLLEMDYEQAIVAFTAAIEIDPEETAAYLGRAEAYIGEDIEEASDESLQSALDDYDTVLELEPERTEAYLGEADIYVVMDDYDSARDILEDGLAYNPDDEELSERLEDIEELIEERLLNRYQAYYDKLIELQELYGKAGLDFDDNADLYYRSGLFFAKLIDFDGDGAEELVTAVFDKDIFEETGYYSNSYLIQVWAYEDEAVQEVYQQEHYKLYLGAGCYIACGEAVSYMVDGYDEYWSGDFPNESFYTYADRAFYAAKMFGSDESDLSYTRTLDGEAVSDEEWNEAYDEWYADITDKLIYYFWWYNGFEATDYETSTAPDELADTLETLRSLLGIEEEEAEEEPFNIFSELPDSFSFYSGVGAWSTDLYLNDDGTFTGYFHDSEPSVSGDGYSSTVYICEFSGKFTNPVQIDEYTYSMELEFLNIEEEEESYIENGIRYVSYVSGYPYGMDDAETFLIYLPGMVLSELPEAILTYFSNNIRSTIPSGVYALYNVSGDEGFIGEMEDCLWNKEYKYEYENTYSTLHPSYVTPSSIVFYDETGASIIYLPFAWSEDNQSVFSAEDARGSGSYEIEIAFNEDKSATWVTITSLDEVDLSPYGGTTDGTLTAEYLLEE